MYTALQPCQLPPPPPQLREMSLDTTCAMAVSHERAFLDSAAAVQMPAQPQQRRGPWSAHEDEKLMTLINDQQPPNWVRIASLIGSRTPKQCRERYHQNLKPTLNHGPITPDEGLLIESLVERLGRRWAEIARHLRGRSDNTVKNWWNGSLNRRKRKILRATGASKRNEAAPYSHQAGRSTHPSGPGHRPAPLVITQQPLPAGHYQPRSPLSPPYSHQYGTETPLPSPTTPGASSVDMTPRSALDGASYYTTSPGTSPSLPSLSCQLPPLKNLPSQPTPSSSVLPSMERLPGCDFFARPLEYRPCTQQKQSPRTMAYLPTAPSSPVSLPPILPDLRRTPSSQGSQPTGDADPRTKLSHLLN